jgi:hypothetical protein
LIEEILPEGGIFYAAVTAATSIYRISIYNQVGTLMNSFSFGGVAEAPLAVSHLKTDVYILKIFDGKSESSDRLVIAR